jgi:hypothetical protein
MSTTDYVFYRLIWLLRYMYSFNSTYSAAIYVFIKNENCRLCPRFISLVLPFSYSFYIISTSIYMNSLIISRSVKKMLSWKKELRAGRIFTVIYLTCSYIVLFVANAYTILHKLLIILVVRRGLKLMSHRRQRKSSKLRQMSSSHLKLV